MAQANSIMVAGHDTTSFMMTNAVYYLATHPEARAKVVAEVDRFGREKLPSHEDLDKFPYVEVSAAHHSFALHIIHSIVFAGKSCVLH